ncbi:NepR family anti-sigma factor [Methylobacterium sp. A49B]
MTGHEDEQAPLATAGMAEAAGPASARPRHPAEPHPAPRRPFDGVARDRIGRGLRLHYAEVLALPIPDRLRTLLDDLAACSDTEVQP